MAGTILFAGDSNTRGYGVGRDRRFVGLVGQHLESAGFDGWTLATATSRSSFGQLRDRLARALDEHAPELVVLQVPTGPATQFVRYPDWIKPLTLRHFRVVARSRQRMIEAVVDERGGAVSQRDVEYEGLYVERLQRRDPASWLGGRYLRWLVAKRYGTIEKATKERYVELVGELATLVAASGPKAVVIHGLIRQSESRYPGWLARATEWTAALAAAHHHPDDHRYFVDVLTPLCRHRDRRVLLNDGTHLTPFGHACVAPVVGDAVARALTGIGHRPSQRGPEGASTTHP
jgi:lysophospholipase L1-like esterase